MEDQNSLLPQSVVESQSEVQQPELPGAQPQKPKAEKAIYAVSTDELLVIPRVMFNYAMIAVSFFILGIIIGGIATNRVIGDTLREENQRLISQAIAAINQNAGAPQQRSGPDLNTRYNVSADNDPFRGPQDALVTIVEFADFRCSFCARFERETVGALLEEYEGQIRVVFRDYPILGEMSVQAAFAAECANVQGAFWPYHDLLYENQALLSRDLFLAVAEELQLDVEAFTACLDNHTYQDEVFADLAAGQELGVSGTPTFFINGRPIIGAQPYAVFASVVNEELAAANESRPGQATPAEPTPEAANS